MQTKLPSRRKTIQAPLPPGVEPEFLTVPQTCTFLGLGRSMVFELLAAGTLDSIKVGKARRIRLASARALGRAA